MNAGKSDKNTPNIVLIANIVPKHRAVAKTFCLRLIWLVFYQITCRSLSRQSVHNMLATNILRSIIYKSNKVAVIRIVLGDKYLEAKTNIDPKKIAPNISK